MSPCLSCKSKISLWLMYLLINSFRLLDVVSKVGSILEIFKEMGRICSSIVLFLINRNSRDSVKLGNYSKYLAKSVLTVKYIVNFEFVS